MTRYPRNISLVLALLASACGDTGDTTSGGSDTTAPMTGDTTGATTTAEPTTDAATSTTDGPTTTTTTNGASEATTSEPTTTTGDALPGPPSQLCVDYCATATACCAEDDACFVSEDCVQMCDLTLKFATYAGPACGERYGEVLKCAATDCRATVAYENQSGACFDMYVANATDPTCQVEALPVCVEACEKFDQCAPGDGGTACEDECTSAILVYQFTGDDECAQAYTAQNECFTGLTCEQLATEEGCDLEPGLECE